MRQKYLNEKKVKESALYRLEGLRMEIRAIEGQDIGDDIWKEKCKELFSLCKELQKENEDLRTLSQLPDMPNLTSPGLESGAYNRNAMAGSLHNEAKPRDGNQSEVDRVRTKTLTTKPSTSAQQNRLIKRTEGYMSGGSLAGTLEINPTDTSPRDSSKSSGLKKIYSK